MGGVGGVGGVYTNLNMLTCDICLFAFLLEDAIRCRPTFHRRRC